MSRQAMLDLRRQLQPKLCSTCGNPVVLDTLCGEDGTLDFPWCDYCVDFVNSNNLIGEQYVPWEFDERGWPPDLLEPTAE